MKEIELIEIAKNARKMSYSKYSSFSVGAALLTKNGKVYTGCNIENISYSLTNCAERTAFFKAISDGENEFEAIAVIGANKDSTDYPTCKPCGACLQVMSEFCDSEFKIILADSDNNISTITLADILPIRFEK